MMLDQLLSPRREAEFVHSRIGELMIQDRLPADVAARIVRERIAEGDPLMIADQGQEWTIRPGQQIGPWGPGQRVWVTQRLVLPSAVVVSGMALPVEFVEVPLPQLSELAELTRWED